MRVLFLPEVRQYFSELTETLLDKKYFSFEDTAVEYVEDQYYAKGEIIYLVRYISNNHRIAKCLFS